MHADLFSVVFLLLGSDASANKCPSRTDVFMMLTFASWDVAPTAFTWATERPLAGYQLELNNFLLVKG